MGLRITNATGQNPTLWLYGPIGDQFGGIVADEVRVALQEIPSKQDIDVHIHSEGGDFWDSIAIHSNLKARQGRTNVIIDSLAASGGSIIAMAGDSIEIAKGGWVMIHEAHGATRGRAEDFRKAAERLDATNEQLVEVYKGRWKGTEKELRAALSNETWLKPDDAISAGLADIISNSMAIAAYVDKAMFNYANLPEELSVELLPEKHRAYEERLAAAIG